MSITLNTTMSSIMTNKRRVGALKSLGVVTVGDALTYYPFRVADPVPLRALREARIGERMAFSASVRGMRVVPMNVRRGYRLEAVVDDGDFAVSRHVAGAAARLVFFSYKKQYVDWLSMRLRSGAIVVIAGEPSEFNGQLQFTHPEIMTVAPGSGPADGEYSGVVQMSALKYDADTVEAGLRRISRPRPVYHASSRISSEHIHESIVQCIELLAGTGQDLPGDAATEAPQTMKPMEDGGISGAGTAPADAESRSGNAVAVGLARAIPDVLPESVRESNHLLHRAEAFLAIHDPLSTADFKRAIGTMRYEEAFVSQTALLQSRSNVRKDAALPCAGVALRDRFIESLPFPLTGGQREVIDDIGVDMAREYPMQRLLQGEVGSGKTVVGMHPASYSAAKSGLLGKLYPDVLKADTSFMQGASLNVEALMALRPDLVLVNAPDKRTLDAVRNAGIPAFGISPSKWHYDIIETHAQWMKSLSEIWPEHKGKGDLIDSRSKAIAKMVADRTKDLRPEERSKVLFLFRYDARQIVTSGRNFFGQYWCDAVGARNVAESVTADNANAIVSMEQIYAWNPDVVFITNFTAATPADLFDNKMAGHDWSDVKAVKDKRVYKLPLGIYRSYTPSADTPLTLLWIAKQVYPSRFADIDLTKEVKAWYKDVFGVTLTDADVDMMFNPGEGASTGATVATRSNG